VEWVKNNPKKTLAFVAGGAIAVAAFPVAAMFIGNTAITIGGGLLARKGSESILNGLAKSSNEKIKEFAENKSVKMISGILAGIAGGYGVSSLFNPNLFTAANDLISGDGAGSNIESVANNGQDVDIEVTKASQEQMMTPADGGGEELQMSQAAPEQLAEMDAQYLDSAYDSFEDGSLTDIQAETIIESNDSIVGFEEYNGVDTPVFGEDLSFQEASDAAVEFYQNHPAPEGARNVFTWQGNPGGTTHFDLDYVAPSTPPPVEAVPSVETNLDNLYQGNEGQEIMTPSNETKIGEAWSSENEMHNDQIDLKVTEKNIEAAEKVLEDQGYEGVVEVSIDLEKLDSNGNTNQVFEAETSKNDISELDKNGKYKETSKTVAEEIVNTKAVVQQNGGNLDNGGTPEGMGTVESNNNVQSSEETVETISRDDVFGKEVNTSSEVTDAQEKVVEDVNQILEETSASEPTQDIEESSNSASVVSDDNLVEDLSINTEVQGGQNDYTSEDVFSDNQESANNENTEQTNPAIDQSESTTTETVLDSTDSQVVDQVSEEIVEQANPAIDESVTETPADISREDIMGGGDNPLSGESQGSSPAETVVKCQLLGK